MYESVLVGIDGSETASDAARVATDLALAIGATLHVVEVYKPGRVEAPGTKHPERFEHASIAQSHVDAAASAARARGLEAKTHLLTGDVAEQIVALAEREGIDLIVVGNKGMKGVRRVLGSVPNAIAHSAACAVLIVNTV
jgi:nucleotide-binding universal stress UspA family protein